MLPQTEVGGEVVKILVDNGTPVTPGMPIMIIKP
jgi:biotin carboxyl carrier protein